MHSVQIHPGTQKLVINMAHDCNAGFRRAFLPWCASHLWLRRANLIVLSIVVLPPDATSLIDSNVTSRRKQQKPVAIMADGNDFEAAKTNLLEELGKIGKGKESLSCPYNFRVLLFSSHKLFIKGLSTRPGNEVSYSGKFIIDCKNPLLLKLWPSNYHRCEFYDRL